MNVLLSSAHQLRTLKRKEAEARQTMLYVTPDIPQILQLPGILYVKSLRDRKDWKDIKTMSDRSMVRPSRSPVIHRFPTSE